MEHLFVYGTLRKALDIAILRKLKDKIEWVGESKVKGRLYDIGKYPGIVSCEENTFVFGDIFKVANSKEVFKILDSYERFYVGEVEKSEYIRKNEVIELDGRKFDVWIYWYNFPIKGKPQIMDGDYLAYLKKKKTA